MRRPLSPEERRLWARVARTVRLAEGRVPPEAPEAPAPAPAGRKPAPARPAAAPSVPGPKPSAPPRPKTVVDPLEPRRQRRLARERDAIEARIDLHGMGRFQAEDALRAFLIDSHARGLRAVLVITGKGSRGGGVIRASVAEWIASAALRHLVAGTAPAHRRHGGEGALYVTLKRRG